MGRSIKLFSSSSFAQQAFSLYPTHVGSLLKPLVVVVLLCSDWKSRCQRRDLTGWHDTGAIQRAYQESRTHGSLAEHKDAGTHETHDDGRARRARGKASNRSGTPTSHGAVGWYLEKVDSKTLSLCVSFCTPKSFWLAVGSIGTFLHPHSCNLKGRIRGTTVSIQKLLGQLSIPIDMDPCQLCSALIHQIAQALVTDACTKADIHFLQRTCTGCGNGLHGRVCNEAGALDIEMRQPTQLCRRYRVWLWLQCSLPHDWTFCGSLGDETKDLIRHGLMITGVAWGVPSCFRQR